MKLHIIEQGDSSVGIPERHYQVDCPFEKDEAEKYDLDQFKSRIIQTYYNWAEMHMEAYYDFELQQLIEP